MTATKNHRLDVSSPSTPSRAFLSLLIAAFIALCLSGTLFADPAYAEVRRSDVIMDKTVEEQDLSVAACPSIDAERAALIGTDGTVYFSRNGGEPAQIASITKIMTAIVAIENAPEGLYVAVSENAALVGESSANLQEGDTMDLETALRALLVPSGNDAAIAIAESVGATMIASDPSLGTDPVQVFVDAMNRKAAELGCTDTFYENPHGLDNDEWAGSLHSTAVDQAIISRAAMGYDLIREIVGGGSCEIAVMRDGKKETLELETTDLLLDMYKFAIGIKTGFTDLAGASFAGAANKDGRELYAVVLSSSDEYNRFVDAKTLFEWGFDHCRELQLANSEYYTTMKVNGESVEVPVIAEVALLDWTDRTVKCTLADPSATLSVFDLDGNVSQQVQFDELHGSVNEGQKVGTIIFKQHNEVIAEQNLVACESVPGPNPIDAVSVWWQRFIGGFSGEPEHADSAVYNVMPILNSSVSNAA